VRLVGEKGEQLGIMPTLQAREMARKLGVDLVEVAPTSVPPVCRLLDYGKFKYEQQKKEQQARKSQKVTATREIRLRPKIGAHDFESKARIAKKLLGVGNKVKVTLMFRGREITHPELGWKVLQRMAETLKEVAYPERQPLMEGRRMDIILAPNASKPKAKMVTGEVARATKKEPVKAAVKETAKEPIKETENAKT